MYPGVVAQPPQAYYGPGPVVPAAVQASVIPSVTGVSGTVVDSGADGSAAIASDLKDASGELQAAGAGAGAGTNTDQLNSNAASAVWVGGVGQAR